MEQDMKMLNDEDAERVVGGNDFLTVKNEKGELQQSGLVINIGRSGNPIYAPLRQSSQSSNAVKETPISSLQLSTQAGMERGSKGNLSLSGTIFENRKLPSTGNNGVYQAGLTFEITKTD